MIKDKHMSLIVTDPIFKKKYFKDSEVIGWLFLEDNGVKMYYVYQRGYDTHGKKFINEPVILLDEPLGDKDTNKELNKVLSEATFHTNETIDNIIKWVDKIKESSTSLT